ncbi:MAG: HAMP domain-containing histidine kinase [Actinomycetota bacterium]|nr:HAMP domain-containing histidine kinase [Actinomycetota bacterium]
MPRLPRFKRIGVRGRILGSWLILLSVASGAALLAQHQVLLNRRALDVRAALEQEIEEFNTLAAGRDPTTGNEFRGNARAIFDTFLRRNIPTEDEMYLTFVDGQPYRLSRPLLQINGFPEAAERWGQLSSPAEGEVDTGVGPVRYRAAPVRSPEGDTTGVFVVAIALRPAIEDINSAMQVGALVWATVLALSAGAAWLAAGRVLAPLRLMTETARSITEADLARRIPIRSSDELADLARTFNSMLGRLERAFTTQRTFIDTTSHELRTPITIVRGHLELLAEDDDDGEKRETYELMMGELDRMSRIVSDLLELARADQPNFARPEPFDLEDFTADILARARVLAPRDWRVEESGRGEVVADRQRLIQAAMILVDNAARYSDDQCPILLGTRRTGDRFLVWVTDFGPGIPAEQQRRIFDPYARADVRGSRTEGMGLGLAIARAIAQAHGGDVNVRSTPDEGATFTICIPLTLSRLAEGNQEVMQGSAGRSQS